MIDKNLFLYDLAVVAIFKDEARYLREWLDYHLLAGVEHFYLYNNDSSDDYREVLAPYVEEDLITLIDFPGKAMQIPAYEDALDKFRFECRYMAFIDIDEFIFPKSNHPIVEVVDEILSNHPDAAGLVANWQIFGSNGQEKADYSRGVLERFTRREAGSNKTTDDNLKTVVNPRRVRYIFSPHFAFYFEGNFAINSNGQIVSAGKNYPTVIDKIVVNHYSVKSREEFLLKMNKSRADATKALDMGHFTYHDFNDVFDDGILKYRAERAKNFSFEDNSERINRVMHCLARTLIQNSSVNLETLLACRALAEKFGIKLGEKSAEEIALTLIYRALTQANTTFLEIRQLIRALPEILSRPFPICKNIKQLIRDNLLPRFNDLLRQSGKFDCIEHYMISYTIKLLKDVEETRR